MVVVFVFVIVLLFFFFVRTASLVVFSCIEVHDGHGEQTVKQSQQVAAEAVQRGGAAGAADVSALS